MSLFSDGTKKSLPHELRLFVSSPEMVNWSAKYLKNYRDALAHRIPLYIPPASYSAADAERSVAIDREELESIRIQDWKKVKTLQSERDRLGAACPLFMHSFDDSEEATPVYLHPQMLSDGKTLIETCKVFLAHWHDRAEVPKE